MIDLTFRQTYRWCIVFLLLLAGPMISSAQEVEIPIDLQTRLFLGVFSYERNHHTPRTYQTTIAIVYQGQYRTSMDVCKLAIAELKQQAAGRPITLVKIDLDEQSLEQAVALLHPQILLLCPLRSLAPESIAAYARQALILTATFVPSYLDAGICLGIGLTHNRPVILINTEAAKAEHADFDSRLLKISQLIQAP